MDGSPPRMKLLSPAQMTSRAREATRAALATFQGRPELRDERLTVRATVEALEGSFELVLPGARPEEDRVLARAVVDRRSGAARVEVLLDPPDPRR